MGAKRSCIELVSFRPKKYFCTICNKGFRRKKQHFNHVMRNKCRAPRTSKKRTRTTKEPVQAVTYTTMSPAPYIGRPYEFNNQVTGNRHLRTGIPFAYDPTRKIQPRVLPKSMPSLGPIPTLSKHKYGLQAI